MKKRFALLPLFALLALPLMAADGKPNILMVTGEPEYGSERSTGEIGAILTAHHDMDVTYIKGLNRSGEQPRPDLIAALERADLIVIFVRFLTLPDAERAALAAYLDKGGPFISCRTSSHLFNYRDERKNTVNEAFPKKYFGTYYQGHHGHRGSQVNYVSQKDHPITRGVRSGFWTSDFLYIANDLPDFCTPLMLGKSLDGRHAATFIAPVEPGQNWILAKDDAARINTQGDAHPVVWTISNAITPRGVVTTIADDNDFALDSVKRLYINAIYWSLDRDSEIPTAGSMLK